MIIRLSRQRVAGTTCPPVTQMKQSISDFFVKQAQDEIDRLWESGELNDEKVESFRQLHERTSYK